MGGTVNEQDPNGEHEEAILRESTRAITGFFVRSFHRAEFQVQSAGSKARSGSGAAGEQRREFLAPDDHFFSAGRGVA
jgi:hypothetical protein